MSNVSRIKNDFTYHPPTPESIPKFKYIRESAELMARLFDHLVPDGREKSLALTKIEEAVFWGNAGIARNQDDSPQL